MGRECLCLVTSTVLQALRNFTGRTAVGISVRRLKVVVILQRGRVMMYFKGSEGIRELWNICYQSDCSVNSVGLVRDVP